MDKKKKFNFGTYKPKTMDKNSIDEGLKKAFSGARSSSELKPINISGQQRKPMKGFEYGNASPKKSEEKEEEPYWTAEQWEEWAYELYQNYPDTHEYLPDWFLEAVEEE